MKNKMKNKKIVLLSEQIIIRLKKELERILLNGTNEVHYNKTKRNNKVQRRKRNKVLSKGAVIGADLRPRRPGRPKKTT